MKVQTNNTPKHNVSHLINTASLYPISCIFPLTQEIFFAIFSSENEFIPEFWAGQPCLLAGALFALSLPESHSATLLRDSSACNLTQVCLFFASG